MTKPCPVPSQTITRWKLNLQLRIRHAARTLAILLASCALFRGNALSAAVPSARSVVNPVAVALYNKARVELALGEWSASFRNFQRYVTQNPSDNAAVLEYLSLARRQHKQDVALMFLARAAASGALPATVVRSDFHVLFGPHPTRKDLVHLVNATARRDGGLPGVSEDGNKTVADSLAERQRAWRFFLLAIGAGTLGDHLVATGFGYTAENLYPHLPGVQKFISWQLFLRHDFKAARFALLQGIGHLDHHPDRLVQQIAIYLGQDRTIDALRLAMAYTRRHPHVLLGHWVLARVYGARGEENLKIHELVYILNFFPDFTPAFRGLLHLAQSHKNKPLEEKLEHLYIASFPKDPFSVVLAARLDAQKGNFASARAVLRRGLHLNPRSREIALALWNDDMDQHRIPQAVAVRKVALLQHPDDPGLMATLLRSLVLEDKGKEALALTRAYVRRAPRSAVREEIYAQLLMSEHRVKQAGRLLGRLHKAMPHRRWVDLLRSDYFRRTHQQKKRIAILERLARRVDVRVSDLFSLANARYQDGNMQQYESVMRQVLRIDPTNAEANNDLAYLWAQRHARLHRALEMATLAVREYPMDSASRDTLGWIYYRLGEFPNALAEFKIAIGLPGRNNPAEYLHLGDTLHKLNKNDLALESWKRGVKLLTPMARLSTHERKLRRKLLKLIAREAKYQALDELRGGQGL